jgi:hypothetical protein
MLAGCAGTIDDMEVSPEGIEQIDTQIMEAMETSSRANQAIAETEVATAAPQRPGPGATLPRTVTLPPAAIQPITVDWQGPVEPFLADVARRAGYTFSVDGTPPPNAMLVNIRAVEEPLYGVVRRAGNQVHGYADIAFNPGSRSIQWRSWPALPRPRDRLT